MGLRKKYLKSRPVCKVTFTVPKELANSAKTIFLVGDFNGWNSQKNPLKKASRGYFSTTIDLDKGKEYQFRYLIDEKDWINDPRADRYVYNDFANCDNSVVSV
jgi:1,4-alpha-glucan branching enzyme